MHLCKNRINRMIFFLFYNIFTFIILSAYYFPTTLNNNDVPIIQPQRTNLQLIFVYSSEFVLYILQIVCDSLHTHQYIMWRLSNANVNVNSGFLIRFSGRFFHSQWSSQFDECIFCDYSSMSMLTISNEVIKSTRDIFLRHLQRNHYHFIRIELSPQFWNERVFLVAFEVKLFKCCRTWDSGEFIGWNQRKIFGWYKIYPEWS